MKLKWSILFILPLCSLFVFNLAAESIHKKKDNKSLITIDEASAILNELKNIRGVLERIEKNSKISLKKPPVRPKVSIISTINRPVLGSDNAPVTLVEISDYQCPYCKRFTDTTLQTLKKEYIDKGMLRIVFKDMPLDFHYKAKKAAQAAHCAGDQNQYWNMHDQLFSNIKKYTENDFISHALTLKLNIKKFKQCIVSDKHYDLIDKDISDVEKSGLRGTPSFIIGKTTQDIIKGDVIIGALPIANFKKYIDKYL